MNLPYFVYQIGSDNVKRYVTYNATKQKYFLTTNRACARLFKLNPFEVIQAKLKQFKDLQPEYKTVKPKSKLTFGRSALKVQNDKRFSSNKPFFHYHTTTPSRS